MQLRIPAFAIAFMVGIGLSLPILAFAYPPPPGPSAYPPRPAPKPKFCPTALVCCDSYRQPYESDAAHLIDLLKVELTVAEKALGVGLTCDAIVGLQREERRRKMRRHEFDFGWDEEEEPDEEEPDEEELDEDEKEFMKRGVDVWFVTSLFFLKVRIENSCLCSLYCSAKVSLCCDKAYSERTRFSPVSTCVYGFLFL